MTGRLLVMLRALLLVVGRLSVLVAVARVLASSNGDMYTCRAERKERFSALLLAQPWSLGKVAGELIQLQAADA